MTDDLIDPLFAEVARPAPDAPARGPAYGPGWTETQGAAGRTRAAELVRQVIERMPPPAVREAQPAAIEVTEKTAFESAVAALVAADKW